MGFTFNGIHSSAMGIRAAGPGNARIAAAKDRSAARASPDCSHRNRKARRSAPRRKAASAAGSPDEPLTAPAPVASPPLAKDRSPPGCGAS